MPFRNPHVSSVTFCLEIGAQDQVEVMVIETTSIHDIPTTVSCPFDS